MTIEEVTSKAINTGLKELPTEKLLLMEFIIMATGKIPNCVIQIIYIRNQIVRLNIENVIRQRAWRHKIFTRVTLNR